MKEARQIISSLHEVQKKKKLSNEYTTSFQKDYGIITIIYYALVKWSVFVDPSRNILKKRKFGVQNEARVDHRFWFSFQQIILKAIHLAKLDTRSFTNIKATWISKGGNKKYSEKYLWVQFSEDWSIKAENRA